ncbi:hypothetical protein [Sulfurovum sp.]|uniref:hypothetical protein n=1 Tax=Sulfurovum sp. TaxID=1969726 RepID=UPI0035663EE9
MAFEGEDLFNLLVTGASGWGSTNDVMSKDRVLEYTDEHIKNKYVADGVLDVALVMQLPTVFACETSWDGTNQPARIGTLTSVQLIGREYRLQYVIDPDIPPIPNEMLFETAANDLGIEVNARGSFPESSRNHWSIKDIDLYRVLLKHQVGLRPKPKVFDIPLVAIDNNMVAVMMPFDVSYNPVYETLQSAIRDLGMICQRADDIWVNDHIIQDVALLLGKAAIVVCDLSGRNANVFYEAGIAHTLGKDVILIAQSPHDIPFDVAAIRYIQYLPNGEGLEQLDRDIQARISTLRERR